MGALLSRHEHQPQKTGLRYRPGGVDSNGNSVGKGDAAAQTRQALKNIGIVLAGAGADFSNVVEFTTYVVVRSSVQRYLDGCGELYPHMYPDRDFPPNTLLVVAGLVRERLSG
ncbi:MAG: RidA family protein [SAR202 cluster bacterium]|nr:RidA family protein [SAR202 cluster bacterium]